MKLAHPKSETSSKGRPAARMSSPGGSRAGGTGGSKYYSACNTADGVPANPQLALFVGSDLHPAVAAQAAALIGCIRRLQPIFGSQPLRKARVEAARDRVFGDSGRGRKSAHFELRCRARSARARKGTGLRGSNGANQ